MIQKSSPRNIPSDTQTVICSKNSEKWQLEAVKSEYWAAANVVAGSTEACAMDMTTWIKSVEFSWTCSRSSVNRNNLDVMYESFMLNISHVCGAVYSYTLWYNKPLLLKIISNFLGMM